MDHTPRTLNWFSGYLPVMPLRGKVAKLVNAESAEIALTQNATSGMNFVAQGLD